LPQWLPPYEQRWGALDPPLRDRLLSASASTLDRLLRPVRARARKGLGTTRSVRHLEGQIPIRTNFRTVVGPGSFEADTVAHCGPSTAGAFVYSLTMTDISSGWTENAAVWNKSCRELRRRLQEIEHGLPFDIKEFDSDNGSEFINHELVRYFHNRADRVHFTRSRPGHKNDQAHVEQKQFTHVRQLLGYDRFDNRRLVALINDLYRNEWRALQNFFLPTMQLLSKTRVGAHIQRRYRPPCTPYQRLLDSPMVSEQAKEQLRRDFAALDPFDLHERIETKLRAIFRLARAPQKTATPPTPQKGATKIPLAA
jgi:hypothetical protein